jgi:hypothetical protein
MILFSQIFSLGQIDTTNKYKSLDTAGHYLSQYNAFLCPQDYLWAICMKQFFGVSTPGYSKTIVLTKKLKEWELSLSLQ